MADPGAAEVHAGNAAYRKADYKTAFDKYEAAAVKAPNDPRINYDRGVAAYKIGNYNEAVDSFTKTLLAEDEKLVGKAQYNLGNALYEKAIQLENTDIDTAIKNLKEGIAYDEKLLAKDKRNKDVKRNLNFLKKELNRLEIKKKEQKEKKSNGSGDSKDKKSSSQDKDQQGQDKQEQKQNDHQSQQDKKDQQDQNKSDEKKADEKKADEKKVDEKKVDDKKPDQEKKAAEQSKPGDDKTPKDQGTAGQGEQGHILSQDEANMLLDDFAQNEQPKGMLKLEREQHQERPVAKDW